MNSDNDPAPQVPSVGIVTRLILYLGFMVAVTVSFNYSLDMINTFFYGGALFTLLNLYLCFLFARHLVIRHRHAVAKLFIQDS